MPQLKKIKVHIFLRKPFKFENHSIEKLFQSIVKEKNDEFHLSGFGLSFKAGINLTLFDHFFVQTELKAGYIDMSDIRTTNSSADSASQEFFFFQRNISFGYIFQLVK